MKVRSASGSYKRSEATKAAPAAKVTLPKTKGAGAHVEVNRDSRRPARRLDKSGTEKLLNVIAADDVESSVALDAIVADGVSIEIVQSSKKLINLMVDHKVLPKSTLQHNAKGTRLSVANSERFVRVMRLRKLAIDAFGEGPADVWLETPLRRFEGRTPMSMMATEAGARAVEQLIERTMHGFNA